MDQVDLMDQINNSVNLIEHEIEFLMHRLEETDPDALLRLEKIFYKFRIRRLVEFPAH